MILYTTDVSAVTEADLEGPFFVGWPDPPDPAAHLRLLRGSDHVVLAVHDGDNRIVGFATAITDGVLAAYIPLLEVVPDYQGRGIGSELVRRLVEAIGPIYMVDAMCDPDLQPFYQHLGLAPATGVMFRNHSRQRGRS
ncbi:MAG TPA: GNAT family N-acetyltransferase [Acidimicrobiia bacterium]|nr:GNAT family N-acetyltransferase [Acidimicrobiia bacterium]